MTCHTKMCAPLPGKDTRPAKEQAKRGQMDREHGIVEKELMNGRVAREMTEARKEARRLQGHSGIRREDPVHAGQASEREKVGTAIPSRSVCGDAELVVRSSGCHRAGTGDQDTLSEH